MELQHQPSPWHPEDEDEHETQILVRHKPTWATKLRRLIKRHWQPRAVDPPDIDPALPHLSGIERAAEVMRHSAHSVEHWIAPTGWFREWLRFTAKITLTLALPVFLVVPLITFALDQFKAWVALLTQTSSNLIYFPLTAILILGLICALIYFGKSLRRRPMDRERHYYQ